MFNFLISKEGKLKKLIKKKDYKQILQVFEDIPQHWLNSSKNQIILNKYLKDISSLAAENICNFKPTKNSLEQLEKLFMFEQSIQNIINYLTKEEFKNTIELTKTLDMGKADSIVDSSILNGNTTKVLVEFKNILSERSFSLYLEYFNQFAFNNELVEHLIENRKVFMLNKNVLKANNIIVNGVVSKKPSDENIELAEALEEMSMCKISSQTAYNALIQKDFIIENEKSYFKLFDLLSADMLEGVIGNITNEIIFKKVLLKTIENKDIIAILSCLRNHFGHNKILAFSSFVKECINIYWNNDKVLNLILQINQITPVLSGEETREIITNIRDIQHKSFVTGEMISQSERINDVTQRQTEQMQSSLNHQKALNSKLDEISLDVELAKQEASAAASAAMSVRNFIR